MSAPINDDADEIDLVAAEFVLGLSDAAARASAQRRLNDDPAFAAAVADWQARFAPLIDEVRPETPPARLWTRIAAEITAPGKIVAFRAPRRLWDSVGLWRAATAGSLAAAMACLAVIATRPQASPPPARAGIMVATLAAPSGGPMFVATFNAVGNDLTVVPVHAVAAAGRSPELWRIPTGGAPQPIGLLDRQPGKAVRLAARTGPRPGDVLAVSLEPPGGSPTGAPTGPVIASGPLTVL